MRLTKMKPPRGKPLWFSALWVSYQYSAQPPVNGTGPRPGSATLMAGSALIDCSAGPIIIEGGGGGGQSRRTYAVAGGTGERSHPEG